MPDILPRINALPDDLEVTLYGHGVPFDDRFDEFHSRTKLTKSDLIKIVSVTTALRSLEADSIAFIHPYEKTRSVVEVWYECLEISSMEAPRTTTADAPIDWDLVHVGMRCCLGNESDLTHLSAVTFSNLVRLIELAGDAPQREVAAVSPGFPVNDAWLIENSKAELDEAKAAFENSQASAERPRH